MCVIVIIIILETSWYKVEFILTLLRGCFPQLSWGASII